MPFARQVRDHLVLAALLGAAMLLPPVLLTTAWLGWEVDRARERSEEMLALSTVEIGSRLDDLLHRFESATAGLRPLDVTSDPLALTARLLRTEPQVAPASGLLIVNDRGRIVATS